MAKAGYSVNTQGAVALAAATAKTVLFVTAGAQFGLDLKKFSIGFDGVTASAVPVFWELNYSTAATNSTPGTGNTSQTANINQVYGRAIATTGLLAGSNCTSEPTVQTNVRANLLTPNGGLLIYDFPLGDVPDCAPANGFALRLTAPAVVNVRVEFLFERI
jgi:hypothetical protein